MARETKKLARQIDQAVGQGANEGLLRALATVDTDRIGRSAREAGDKWASQFERRVTAGLKDMADDLPTFAPDADMDQFDEAIAKTKRELAELAKAKITPGQGGTGGLDAVGRKLDEITARMHTLSWAAEDADRQLQLRGFARQAEMLRGLVDAAAEQGSQHGRLYGGRFAAEASERINKALRDIPEVQVDANVDPAERELADLREQLVQLGDRKIGIDIDREQFGRQLGEIVSRLESLARRPHRIGLEFDLNAAVAGLRDFQNRIEPILDRDLAEIGRNNGNTWAGAYADAVANRVQRAAQAIPNLPVRIDDSPAQRSLAAIRLQLEALADKQIGVNISAAAAEAQLLAIRTQLEALDRADVSVDVRTNAAAAAAQIRLIRDATDDASGGMQNFAQNATITMSRLGYLIAIGASLGSLIAPAAATAAVAIAGIGVAAAGAVAGFGVLALGLVGIGDAVSKIDKYQQDADKSAQSFAQAQSRVINATEAVRDAEQNLANARQQAADGAVQAQERIQDAQRAAARAQRDAAEAVARARRNEREAIEDVARARADAHDMVERAVESQEDAERGLERAVKDQKQARQELNEAIRDAVIDLRNLDTAVRRNALEIDEATTASMRAKEELDKLMTNPRATEIEKRMALEAYRDKIIQIEELKNRGEELRVQQERAAKEGVESTDRVKRARDQVANADERAADAARRLEDARKAVDRARLDASEKIEKAQQRVADAHTATLKAQRDGAERVADAQRSVADAQRDAARQQQQSQQQIANAVQAVTRAQRGLAQASTAAGMAGGEAFDNMNDALEKLSPAGRAFAQWLYSLKPRLDQLRATAQAGLLPGLQDAIQILVDRYFPSFDRFVGKIARGLGDMFRASGLILATNPEWQKFFAFLDAKALPALQGMWVSALNVARGVANLVRALNPLAEPMGQGLVELTERFARWSDQLQNDNGFQKFMEYTARVAPKVVNLIEQIAEFMGRLVVAMAPMGEFLVDVITSVFEFMNSWDIGFLTGVVTVVAILGTTIWALTGFVRTVRFVTEAWTAVSLIAARAQGLLAVAVGRFRTATGLATAQTTLMNGAMLRTGAAGAVGAGGMAAMTGAAGPLGIAILAIGAAWFLVSQEQRRSEEATDELTQGLVELGETYNKVGLAAGRNSAVVADSLKRVAAQNEDLQRAVITLDQLGVGLTDIAGAAAGGAQELDRVVQVINTRIDELLVLIANANDAADEGGIDVGASLEEIKLLEQMRDKFQEAADKAHVASDAMMILNSSTQDLSQTSVALTPAQQALAEAHRVLADQSSTAQEKIDALAEAEDKIRQSAVDAVEAEEQWNSSLITLKDSVDSAKAASDKHAASLGLNTSTGLRNRDMLENLIESANRMYAADVALNGVTDQAVRKGNDHIGQIRKLAKELGLNEQQTNDLIKTYRKIPTNIKTAVSMDPNSFNAVYNNLRRMLFMQDAAKRGLSPDQAEREWNVREAKRNAGSRKPGAQMGFATGGPIGGVGGPTEDANLIWASKGEFMQPATAVDYYGPDFMEALRRRQIPKQIIPGFADGGAITRPNWTWPIKYKVPNLDIPTMDEIFSGTGFGGPLGGVAGGRGYKWQMAALRRIFPGLRLISGYRPGSRTLSGNLSWHARGRAVDLPPTRKVAEYIARTYGKSTLELITPWRDLMLLRGRHHRFSPAVEAQHGVGRAGNDHIHWAYDEGGMLPPGYTNAFNGTGKPEAVLTNQQWQMIAQLARGTDDGRRGNTYQFEFRDTTLDAGRLRAIQEREAVLARAGRAR